MISSNRHLVVASSTHHPYAVGSWIPARAWCTTFPKAGSSARVNGNTIIVKVECLKGIMGSSDRACLARQRYRFLVDAVNNVLLRVMCSESCQGRDRWRCLNGGGRRSRPFVTATPSRHGGCDGARRIISDNGALIMPIHGWLSRAMLWLRLVT